MIEKSRSGGIIISIDVYEDTTIRSSFCGFKEQIVGFHGKELYLEIGYQIYTHQKQCIGHGMIRENPYQGETE